MERKKEKNCFAAKLFTAYFIFKESVFLKAKFLTKEKKKRQIGKKENVCRGGNKSGSKKKKKKKKKGCRDPCSVIRKRRK